MKPEHLLSVILTFLLLSSFCLTAQPKTDEERAQYAHGLLSRGKQENDPMLTAEGYFILGKIELIHSRFTEAYRLFNTSLEIYQKHGNQEKEAKVLLRLSGVEFKQGFTERAKEYLWKALRIYEKINDTKGIASAYMHAGVLSRSASPDSALYYYYKAYNIFESNKDRKGLADAELRIGRVFANRGDKERAIFHLQNATDTAVVYENTGLALYFRKELASNLLKFKLTDQAFLVLQDAQSIVDRGGNIALQYLAGYYHIVAQYYTAINDAEKALEINEKASTIYSLMPETERKDVSLTLLGEKLVLQHKSLVQAIRKKEEEAHQKKILYHRILLALLAMGVTVMAILSYLLHKNYKTQKSLRLKNAFLVQEQHHRVKNNLQVISSMLSLQQDQVADEASRDVLHENQMRIDSMVLLHKQLYDNQDVDLIDIEELAYDIVGSVSFTFGRKEYELNLDMQIKYLPPDLATSVGVILNELVVNSYKHTFSDRAPRIDITSRQHNGFMEITYEDFGKVNLEKILKGQAEKGFGLQLIEMVLFQINGDLKYSFGESSMFTLRFKHKVE